MANLLFRPAELLSEIEALRNLSDSFLDPTSFQLEELAGEIQGLVTQKGGTLALEIPRERPLRTRLSEGEFEPANKSSNRRIFAEVSGIWEIKAAKYKVKDPKRPGKKAKEELLIGFNGLASTVISVFDEGVVIPITCWKMELGDANAPGCFFHTFASVDHGFPVPRHPNVFPTPMSAIEFALGELFQDPWEKAVSGATDPPQRWRSIQGKRLKALLNWQMQIIENATTSPWFTLKARKPAADIFLWP
ncbi:hypothetical protein [Vulgatibacter incomptus]|uniref:hypothetical protein n=1 Tax=Vulgatibacter incomptus TaxID=1391653 RepID=UPI00067FA941|nr:hypothetical protein [Vulgatibacter incomptus]